jgi:hypothetical protein
MRNETRLLFLLLTAVCLLAACDKDDPVTPGAGGSLYPLTIGNSWTYRSMRFDSLGNSKSLDTVEFSITKDTLVGNEHWFSLGSGVGEYLANRGDGTWYMRINSSGVITQQPVMFFRYPAAVNDSWLTMDSGMATLTGKDVSVTVPAGTYKCLRYAYDIAKWDFHQIMDVAPGVGYVKEEVFAKRFSGVQYVESRRELIKVQLK